MQGFKVLRVKIDESSTVERHLFIKAHSSKEVDAYRPKERTLFVLNIPPYIQKEHIEKFFLIHGAIENVYLHSKPTSEPPILIDSQYFPKAENPKGYKLAYVVFRHESSVKNALNFSSKKVRVLTKNTSDPLLTGIEKYCQEYIDSAVDPEKLLPKLKKYFETYDENKKEEELKSKLAADTADSEGWTTVNRHSKIKASSNKSSKNKRRFRRREKKKKEVKELLDFYTFQHKESQQSRIVLLREKFEEDKQKIALMKAARKFKPF